MSFQKRAALVAVPLSVPVALIWVLSFGHADGQEKPTKVVLPTKGTIPAKAPALPATKATKGAPAVPGNSANKETTPARGATPPTGGAPGTSGGGITGAAGRGDTSTKTGAPAAGGGITGAGGARGGNPANGGPPAAGGGITGAGGARGGNPANGGTPAAGGGITGSGGRGAPPQGPGRAGNAAPRTRLARPGEQATKNPDGSHLYTDTRTGAKVQTGPDDRVVKVESPKGAAATRFMADGRPGHIEQKRADGSKLVVNQGGRGREVFVERPMPGRPGYVSRTYVHGGRTEVRVYRTNTYHGVPYAIYVAPRHYQPAFYGWADRPWGVHAAYSWGPPAPWFYGGYFAPQQFYDSPSLWLTDYLLAANLQLAFASQQQDSAPPPQDPGAPLSPEVKFLISLEVQRQIEAEQKASTAPPPPPPPPGQTAPEADPPVLNEKVFFVSSSIDVVSAQNGAACTLSGGDVIERTPNKPVGADGKITVDVMSSKAGGCPADFTTQLDVAQLQDMLNEFRAQLSEGMGKLADGQERGKGLPASPPAGSTPSRDGAAPAPSPGDSQAQLDQEARQTEADIQQYIASGQ